MMVRFLLIDTRWQKIETDAEWVKKEIPAMLLEGAMKRYFPFRVCYRRKHSPHGLG